VCRTARQSSKLPDEVRFLGGALKENTSLECAGYRTRPREGRRPGSIPGEDTR